MCHTGMVIRRWMDSCCFGPGHRFRAGPSLMWLPWDPCDRGRNDFMIFPLKSWELCSSGWWWLEHEFYYFPFHTWVGIILPKLTNSIILQDGHIAPPTSCNWLFGNVFFRSWEAVFEKAAIPNSFSSELVPGNSHSVRNCVPLVLQTWLGNP